MIVTTRWLCNPEFLIQNHKDRPQELERATHTKEEAFQVYVHCTFNPEGRL